MTRFSAVSMFRISWVTLILSAVILGICSAANPLSMITDRIPNMHVQIERLDPCADEDTPIRFQDLVISKTGFNRYALTGVINITEVLDRPLSLELQMHKCRSKGDPDSCEYYFTFRQKGICDMLEKNSKTWDYFTSSTNLPKACPFPPGTYIINGAVIDLQEMKSIPLMQSHWRLRNKGYMDDKLMFCLVSEFELQFKAKS